MGMFLFSRQVRGELEVEWPGACKAKSGRHVSGGRAGLFRLAMKQPKPTAPFELASGKPDQALVPCTCGMYAAKYRHLGSFPRNKAQLPSHPGPLFCGAQCRDVFFSSPRHLSQAPNNPAPPLDELQP